MTVAEHPPRTTKAPVISWAFWDWGSAAFNAVLVTFIFSVYLTDSVGSTLPSGNATSLYSMAVALAGVVVAVVAPVMGRRSDIRGTRRASLRIWTLVTVLLMFSLFAVKNTDPVYFWIGVAIMAVANVTFEFAEVQYYAQLSQVSTAKTVGRISGFGWSMGYFGGIFLLLICYFGFVAGEGDTRGFLNIPTKEGLNIRLVAVFAAVWFLVSALPALFRIPEITPQSTEASQPRGIVAAYADLFQQIGQLWRSNRNAVFFLIASAVFRDGLAGVFTFGAILAVTVYGLSAGDVLLFGVAANVISAFGALLGGFLDDRIGPKPIIIVSLLIMVVDVAILYFVDGPQNFWIFGLILCAFVGPAQSASRSFLTRLSPDNQEGQLFGLYATTGRAVSWMAPTLFGLFVAITGEDRAGIWGIGLLLLVGAGLLTMVKAPGTTASLQPGSLADSPRE
ncbi:MFS transporter [Corynebacterium gallinarum]|uniref:MFS transporter n=1 Tax=Corynebacterium gallinarum TaxID=2762214 RepID=A0A8I0LH54_9CORY|nr:MFS transporter [Corynebacterium gallinarum]MBD8030035.1 MFS transporter [Corynebacterium gallinarum]